MYRTTNWPSYTAALKRRVSLSMKVTRAGAIVWNEAVNTSEYLRRAHDPDPEPHHRMARQTRHNSG
jgi:hypothetical protein